MTVADSTTHVVIDPEHPWPGLDAFPEHAASFFNGRAAEIARLVRLVEGDTLTLLYGASGLGKTSLLLAGLFPKARVNHYLPVYLRLDLTTATPFVEQLRDGFVREMTSWGVDAPPFADGESLWQYLHRRPLELWSRDNFLLTPLFVLDQFEELFTIGAGAGDAGVRFQADLSDLVANRLPTDLERRMARDDQLAEALNFYASAYRIILSFREDFLPELREWGSRIPTLMRSYLRLRPMNGLAAFQAVHTTAPHLVDPDLARNIVRFVAAAPATRPSAPASGAPAAPRDPGLEMPSAEDAALESLNVEPSLLSLVCHGLNKKRLEPPKKDRIDAHLLEQTGPAIIADFYDTALRGMRDTVVRFVQNELVTESGYRNTCAVDDAVTTHRVSPEELRQLVDRRLIRIEPQQGVDRIELTHDLLTAIVTERRNERRIRDSEAVVQRNLEARRRRVWRLVGVSAVTIAVVAIAILWLVVRQKQVTDDMARLLQAERLSAEDPTTAALLLLELKRTAGLSVKSTALKVLSNPLSAAQLHHDGPVLWSDISPDGARIVTASADQTAAIWQTDSRSAPVVLRHAAEVVRALFNGAGDRVVTFALDGAARVWAIDGRAMTPNMPHPRVVSAAAIQHQGRYVLTGSFDGTVRLWRTDAPASPAHVAEPTSDAEIPVVAFDEQGERFLAVSADGLVRVWHIGAQGVEPPAACQFDRRLLTAAFKGDGIQTVAVDGTIFVSMPAAGDRPRGCSTNVQVTAPPGVTVISTTERDLQTILATVDPFRQARTDAEGLSGADASSGASDVNADSVKLWGWPGVLREPGNNKERRDVTVLPGAGPAARARVFGPSGDGFVGGFTDGRVRLWRLSSPAEPIALAGHTGRITHIASSRTGDIVVTTSNDMTARVWRFNQSGEPSGLPYVVLKHARNVTSVDISGDGRRVLTSALNGEAHLWELDGRRVRKFVHQGAVRHASFSPDGQQILTIASDGNLRLWRAGDDATRPFLVLDQPGDRAVHAEFSADGTRILSTSAGAVRVWRVDSPSDPLVLGAQTTYDIRGQASFSPSGDRVVAAVDSETTVIWDSRTGAEIASFSQPPGKEVKGALFAADGTGVLTMSPDAARLWTIGRRDPAVEYRHQGLEIAAFSKDGSRLLTGAADGSALIWRTGRSDAPLSLSGHQERILGGHFSDDGGYVITASADRTARLWSVEGTGQPVVLNGHTKALVDARFTPAADRVVTASSDGRAVIWTIGTEMLLENARARTHGCLPAQFRSRYLLEEPAAAQRNAERCEQAQRTAPAR